MNALLYVLKKYADQFIEEAEMSYEERWEKVSYLKERCGGFLRALGWKSIGYGVFKEVYGKRGVPFVIKIGIFDMIGLDNFRDLILEETAISFKKNEKSGSSYGVLIQDRIAATVDEVRSNPKKGQYISNKFRKIAETINSDSHERNIGILPNGKMVQFDLG